MYRGYAAAADAAWDEKSLDFAVKRFSHLLEAYFPGSEHVYMSVIPDKAAFMETPEGYTPAGAQETADYLAQRLPVEIIDIAPLLALEDYYRTDPHWRQERLSAVAQAILEAMDAPVPDTTEETLCALAGEFHGSYWGKTAEPLTADVLSYITSPLLDGCTVYDYETDSTGGVYDFTAAEKSPYDLFLGGPKALLRIENPAGGQRPDADRVPGFLRQQPCAAVGGQLPHRLCGRYPVYGHRRAGTGDGIPGGGGCTAAVQRCRTAKQHYA